MNYEVVDKIIPIDTNKKVKIIAEKRWCEYYGKTKEDFRERYGRDYL